MIHSLLHLPTWARRSVMVAVDVTAVLLAIWAAFAIRLGEWWPGWLDDVLWLFPLAVATTIPALAGFGLYHSIVRHAGGSLAYVIVKGVSAGTLLMIAVWILAGGPLVPRSAWIIYWMVAVAIIGASRFVIRDLLSMRIRRKAPRERVACGRVGRRREEELHGIPAVRRLHGVVGARRTEGGKAHAHGLVGLNGRVVGLQFCLHVG